MATSQMGERLVRILTNLREDLRAEGTKERDTAIFRDIFALNNEMGRLAAADDRLRGPLQDAQRVLNAVTVNAKGGRIAEARVALDQAEREIANALARGRLRKDL